MFTEIESYCTKHELIKSGSTIVIGLSGGPDSVFLLLFLVSIRKAYNLTLIATHLDHGWRANSGNDVVFCANLCAQYNILYEPAHLQQLNLSFKKNGSSEEFGRKARRTLFEMIARKHNADSIALGHHADDQQETFFIRLVRGTTLSGLISMKPQEGIYIRPLLQTHKKDILNYLETNGITYLIDPTNESDVYLRNRIRNHVLPALKSCDERFDNNFLRTINSLSEAEKTLTDLTKFYYESMVTTTNDIQNIDLKALLSHSEYLQKRIIVMWIIAHKVPFTLTEKLLDEILRFLRQPDDKAHHIGTEWKIVKKNNLAHIVTL
jgi:tRNA(Ile)-lysidine synthase